MIRVRMFENPFFDTSFDLLEDVLKKEPITDKTNNIKSDKEFLKELKEKDWFKTAPKEVVDFLNSLDKIKEPENTPKVDPNEEISFWITYQATFITELYSPEFFKRNPQEVLDDIDDLSLKITLTRDMMKDTKNAYDYIKKEFVKTLIKALNIDPNTFGSEFKDSFLAKTGIIYMDIIGVDLTKSVKEKYAGSDDDIDKFMIAVYNGMNKDTDIITYRDIETLIK